MNAKAVEKIITQALTIGDCEVTIYTKDGQKVVYFFGGERHTYHRGLNEMSVDLDLNMICAGSEYGLSGQAEIADFIDIDNVTMISVLSNDNELATL